MPTSSGARRKEIAGRTREGRDYAKRRENENEAKPHGDSSRDEAERRRASARERACNVCRLQECHYVSFARVR